MHGLDSLNSIHFKPTLPLYEEVIPHRLHHVVNGLCIDLVMESSRSRRVDLILRNPAMKSEISRSCEAKTLVEISYCFATCSETQIS